MANYATITNGIVSNVYVADDPLVFGDPLVTTQGIGWAYINGQFVAPFIPVPAPAPLTVDQQINALESTMTLRRIREAANGTDGGWLKNLDAQIAALRATLGKGTP